MTDETESEHIQELAGDTLKDLDLAVGGDGRSTRVVKEDGITTLVQKFDVTNAVKTVEQMGKQAREQGVNRHAETRVAAVLHEGQLTQIANKHGITVKQLMFDKNYEDLLWAEATGRDYSKMQIHKA